MNSKIARKRRTDRNQVIYYIRDIVTQECYIGLTALSFKGNVFRTLRRRMQKHMQRAMTENKDWGLSRALRERGAERFVFGTLDKHFIGTSRGIKLEIYAEKRYLTVTGNRFRGSKIASVFNLSAVAPTPLACVSSVSSLSSVTSLENIIYNC